MIVPMGLGPRAGTYGVCGTWNVRWTQAPRYTAYAVSHGALPMSAEYVDVLASWQTIDELDVCHAITEHAHVRFEDGYIARWTMRGTCRVELLPERMRIDVTYHTAKLTTMRGQPAVGLVAYANKTLAMRPRKASWSIVGLCDSYRIDEYATSRDASHLALLSRM